MRTPRRALLALVAAALLAGCTATTDGHLSGSPTPSGTSGSGSATPPVTAPRARFTDCGGQLDLSVLGLSRAKLDALTVDCAGLPVPLDYGNPDGRKIEVGIVRIHKAGTKPIGSLIVNPGGPGGSAVEYALGAIPQVYDTLLDHFDLVGFDPRGVGLSTPVHCLTDAQKDTEFAASPNMLTQAGFAEADSAAAALDRACGADAGSALPYFNTVNTARDMDLVRQALGDPSLNYLGFSYGTELGAQYLHLFPTHMRVAVLDGAVDPLTSDIAQSAQQLQGFEDAFDQFAAYCVTNATCKAIGSPRKAVAAIAAAADRTGGLPVQGTTRRATSSLVYTGVLSALYSRMSWPTLGTALRQGQQSNGKGLLALADRYYERSDGRYSNETDANTVIGCNDSPPGPSDAVIRSTTASWAKRFPLFGLTSAPGLFACQDWPTTRRTVPPLPTARTTPRKVLVIGNLHDPATPYKGAQDLAKTLGNAELLTWNGQGHTSYLEGSSCVDSKVNAYLVSGTLPAAGTTCPP